MFKKNLFIFIFLLNLIILNGNELIKFRTQWLPQAQFIGYYIALEKGFFKEENINVEILSGGPGINQFTEVARGDLNFTTAWLSSAIQQASQGVPVICVSQIFSKNMLVLVAKKKTNIKKLEDLKDRKIGTWAGGLFSVPIRAMLKTVSITPNFVEVGFEVDSFVEDKIEVINAMLYNEFNLILSKGVKREDLVIFNPIDYGIVFPEDGIYTSKSFFEKNPAAVKKFVNASLKGWDYALANPKEAIDILMKIIERNKISTTREHQEAMFKIISDSIKKVDKKNSYILEEKDFNFVYNKLKESNLIGNKEVKYGEFYQIIK